MTCAAEVYPRAFRRTVLPQAEPLELADAQVFLRKPVVTPDAATSAFLAQVRDAVEGYIERALITQTWEARLDAFWGSADLVLPWPTLQAVTHIKYLADETDVETTVDSTVYEVDAVSLPGRVRLRPGQSWPVAYARAGAVRVTYTCGYGGSASDMPPKVAGALRLLLGSAERHREGVVVGTISNVLPLAVQDLLAQERIPWPGD